MAITANSKGTAGLFLLMITLINKFTALINTVTAFEYKSR